MYIDSDTKAEILWVLMKVIKKIRGIEPKNICLNCYENELHISFEGLLTNMEKILIEDFGKEVEKTIISLFKSGAKIAEARNGTDINKKLNLWTYDLECNLKSDKYVLKMKSFCK